MCESYGTLQLACSLRILHQNKNCQGTVNEGQKALGEEAPLPPGTWGKINMSVHLSTGRFSPSVRESRGYQSPSVVSLFILAIKKRLLPISCLKHGQFCNLSMQKHISWVLVQAGNCQLHPHLFLTGTDTVVSYTAFSSQFSLKVSPFLWQNSPAQILVDNWPWN